MVQKNIVVKEKTFNKRLPDMPKQIRDFVLFEQNQIETKKDTQFSFAKTIYSLLKTHPKFINYISK